MHLITMMKMNNPAIIPKMMPTTAKVDKELLDESLLVQLLHEL